MKLRIAAGGTDQLSESRLNPIGQVHAAKHSRLDDFLETLDVSQHLPSPHPKLLATAFSKPLSQVAIVTAKYCQPSFSSDSDCT